MSQMDILLLIYIFISYYLFCFIYYFYNGNDFAEVAKNLA